MLGTKTVFYLWICLGILGLVITRLGIIRKKQQMIPFEHSEIKFKLNDLIFFIIFIICSVIIFLNSISPYFIFYGIVSYISIKLLIDWYIDLLHIKFKQDIYPRLILLSLFGIQLSFVYLLSFSAKKEIASTEFSIEQRIQTFAFYRNFGIKLSSKDVSEFLTSSFSKEILSELFNYSSDEVFLVNVDTIILNPDFKVYSNYIKTGKASFENLEKIYIKLTLDKKEWGHPEEYKRFRKIFSFYFPKAKDLPERNIASLKNGRD